MPSLGMADINGFTSPWRCLVIEDDEANAGHIAKAFREQGYEVQVCGDGSEALRLGLAETWDLVILDRMLRDGVDGLAVLAELRRRGRAMPVLVVSALSDLDQRVRGLKAGGDDYLTKPFEISELLARAEAVIRRCRPPAPNRKLEVADLSLDLFTRKAERAGRVIPLQPRELKLLAFFMSHCGQVLTRKMLLEAVWDYRFDPRTNVIDVHVSRLRNKIEQPGEAQLIHTERGVGYRMHAPAETRQDSAG